MALILLGYYNRNRDTTYHLDRQLSRNVYSAINLLMEDTGSFIGNHSDIVDLFDKETDSVIVEKEQWGLYNIGSVTASYGRRSKTKTFMYGASGATFMDACIYMADH